MTAAEVQKAAKSAGLAWRTVQRARNAAGVETRREGFGKGATYWWDMRATDPPSQKGGIHGTRGTHAANKGFPADHDRHARHACQPTDTGTHGTDGTRADLFKMATEACKGLTVDPSELADFITRQNDPEIHNPAAVRRWAELIHERGGVPDE
jgi:hypothetical protein